MKKPSVKFTVILGVIVVLLLAGASWYSIMFNDWRLVAPVDLSTYEFVPQDLPMIISTLLFVLYVLYLAALILGAAIASKRRQETANTTRRLNPKLGLLGFAGFLGFLGFWTYGAFRDITPVQHPDGRAVCGKQAPGGADGPSGHAGHRLFNADPVWPGGAAGQLGVHPHRRADCALPDGGAESVPQRVPALPL